MFGAQTPVMKIQPPSLGGVPKLVDVVKTPSSGGTIPVPVPNLPSSSFTPANGVERRFSVRFLQSVGAKLTLAGVDAPLVKDLSHRFKHMDRTGLDREGRIVERLLESANPKEAMALYGLMAQLGSIVAPNGSSVSANDAGSWTVRPRGGEPFELLAKAGQRAELGDGLTAKVKDSNTVEVAGQQLNRESSQRSQQRSQEFAIALGPASSMLAATHNPLPLIGVLGWYASQNTSDQLGAFGHFFDRIGAPELGAACHVASRGAGAGADAFAMLALPTGRPLTSAAASLLTMNAMPGHAHQHVLGLLEKTGRSAAPSSRSDPLLEKAAILGFVGRQGATFMERTDQALSAVTAFAARIHGVAREVIIATQG